MNQERHFLIADDHSVVRKGLLQILKDAYTRSIIHEAGDGNEALRKAREYKLDLIISDISMPGLNGLDLLKQLKVEQPDIPVLILSIHPESQYALRALKAGASGYITKESAAEELVNAVSTILNGHKYISTSIADKLANSYSKPEQHALHEVLSDREFEVMKLIASGKTVSEIAVQLSLSINTISTYRARILDKMSIKNNAEITHYVISNHLI